MALYNNPYQYSFGVPGQMNQFQQQPVQIPAQPVQQPQQLINAINPAPIPAYQVPNPNTFYGCGCNTGCNC